VAEHELDPSEMEKLEAPERVGRMPPQEVIDLLDPHPGVRCLDLGAGTGYLARPLASHLAPGGVVAVDRSRPMLVELGRRAEEETGVWVPRIVADAGALPFGHGAFGRVLAVNLLHELDDAGAALAEVRRVLADGGRAVVVDWAPSEEPAGPPQERRWSAREIQEGLREAGFGDVEAHDLLEHHAAVTAEGWA
jgi:ubiquinone/menaquinone biosynthesis C-methylase UbiE